MICRTHIFGCQVAWHAMSAAFSCSLFDATHC
jgi:hypothetical protein